MGKAAGKIAGICPPLARRGRLPRRRSRPAPSFTFIFLRAAMDGRRIAILPVIANARR
jgi:hypothetical protein